MAKKLGLFTITAMALIILLTACTTRDPDPPPPPPTGSTIYAVGCDGDSRPVIWKNGQSIFTGATQGEFYSVFVSNGVHYAVGEAYIASQGEYCPVFHTGHSNTLQFLEWPYALLTSVYVSGGYMYVGWFDYDYQDGGVMRARINPSGIGNFEDVDYFGEWTCPLSIFVSSGNVYAGGSDWFGGSIWENGTKISADLSSWDNVYSIFVSGGIIHAVGEANERPAYFKSGNAPSYYLGSGYGIAKSVYVTGNNVCVAGEDGTGGKIWNGATTAPFPATVLLNFGANVEPTSVFVSDGDVYMGGANWGTGRSGVWRNNTGLYNFGFDSWVNSVFVDRPLPII